MINKQNLWFVTLFALILVLGIYYVSMKDEAISVLSSTPSSEEVIEVEDSSLIVALQVEEDEQVLKEMKTHEDVLLNTEATLEEKNDAYNSLQVIASKKEECEKIKKLIKDKFNYDNFVKIDNDTISIVISSNEHDKTIANNIIKEVQSLYDKQKYITVKFGK